MSCSILLTTLILTAHPFHVWHWFSLPCYGHTSSRQLCPGVCLAKWESSLQLALVITSQPHNVLWAHSNPLPPPCWSNTRLIQSSTLATQLLHLPNQSSQSTKSLTWYPPALILSMVFGLWFLAQPFPSRCTRLLCPTTPLTAPLCVAQSANPCIHNPLTAFPIDHS